MDKDLTPEERLLKLIKSPKPEAEDKGAGVESGEPVVEKIHKGQRPIKMDVNVNGILTVALAAVLIVGIGGLILKKVFFSQDIQNISVEKTLSASKVKQNPNTPKTKSFSHYSSQIKKRQLFKPLVAQRPKTIKQEPEVKIEDLAKTLKLMGIVDGNPPQAIIEDSKTKQTHFVSEKDKIGKLTVGEVKNGRVILKLEEQTFNLSL